MPVLSTDKTAGSKETSRSKKIELASSSMDFNCGSKVFCRLFPDLVAGHHEAKA